MQSDKVISMMKLHVNESIHDQSGGTSVKSETPPRLVTMCEEHLDVLPSDSPSCVSHSNHAGIGEIQLGRLPLSGELDQRVHLFDDGFRSQKALMNTVYRVSMIAGAYLFATTALTVLGGLYHNVYGLGPIEMAVLNALSIVYFVVVMLPFCLFSAWCLRYNQESPFQQRIFDLTMPAGEAFELSMAAMESLPGTSFASADTRYGIIKYLGSGNRKCGRQEISVKLENLSPDKTRIHITSHPKLSAVHYLLFGYTLAVDGSRNKRNVDEITAFLASCSENQRSE